MTNTGWLYGAGAVLAVIVLAAFWRSIVRALLLLAGLGLSGLLVWALAQQASATRQAATAATVAATGSTAGNVVTGLLVALLVVTLSAGGLYVWLLRRRIAQPAPGMPQAALGADPLKALDTLVQIELLHVLRDLRAPQQLQMALPRYDVDDNEPREIAPAWW